MTRPGWRSSRPVTAPKLEAAPADVALAHLLELSNGAELLLLTATRDLERSGAAVLKAILDAM